MLKNHLKVTIRNLIRFKTFSLINILGLAVGMGCFILISLFVIDDLNYEKFHVNSGRIYRIVSEGYIGTPAAFAPALERNLSEISETVRLDNFTRRTKKLFSYKEKRFYENRFILAEPSLFKIFTFAFLKGNPESALNDPKSIVLTETTAKRYFGEDNPVGKIITLENQWDFTVTGVLRDIPDKTHLKFDMLAPFAFNEREDRYGKNLHQNWGQSNFVTYFLLPEGKHFNIDRLEEAINLVNNESEGKRYKRKFFLQSLNDIHLTSNLAAEFETNSSVRSVVSYSITGLIILLIACLNSMNLSTARSIKRAKEVGIRKVVGANRIQLAMQFFGESLMMSVLAIFIALLLVSVLLSPFNVLTGKNLSLLHSSLSIFIIIIMTTAVTVIGSGVYPAIFLSAFQPSRAFKSNLLPRSEGSLLRKILVLVQFSLSIIFLICTFVVWNQLNYVKKRNMGMNKEHVVNIPLHREVQEKYELIKNDIRRHPGVIHTAASNFPALAPYHHGLYWEGMSEEEDKSMFWFSVDHDFIETLDIVTMDGRAFSRDFSTDTITAYIFNESAVREFGKDFLKERKFSLFGQRYSAPVIGIVKDFHYTSLRERILPLALCVYPRYFNHISIRIDYRNIPAVLGHLEEVWKNYVPNRPFEYFFLDDRFDSMYKSEERLGKLFSYFSLLAIFISCLGLFALSAFMAEQRTKEIGVRKVLGASVLDITILLSKEFLKWVVYANIIAWPIAYYVMKKWLDNFYYRTNIGVFIFLFSGFLVLGIALLTISYQSTKAALSNPVETLKHE